MSLQSVRSQIIALGKRLDVMSGRGQQVEYVWSALDDEGEKVYFAGDIHSMADDVIEIQAGLLPGDAPKILINGKEKIIGAATPAISLDEVLIHDTDS